MAKAEEPSPLCRHSFLACLSLAPLLVLLLVPHSYTPLAYIFIIQIVYHSCLDPHFHSNTLFFHKFCTLHPIIVARLSQSIPFLPLHHSTLHSTFTRPSLKGWHVTTAVVVTYWPISPCIDFCDVCSIPGSVLGVA